MKHDRQKTDALLRSETSRNAQLTKKLKEEKRHADEQRREHDRYTKEERKKVLWLERKLSESSMKDRQIEKLKAQLEQKEKTMMRLRQKIKEKEETQARATQRYVRAAGLASQQSQSQSQTGHRGQAQLQPVMAGSANALQSRE